MKKKETAPRQDDDEIHKGPECGHKTPLDMVCGACYVFPWSRYWALDASNDNRAATPKPPVMPQETTPDPWGRLVRYSVGAGRAEVYWADGVDAALATERAAHAAALAAKDEEIAQLKARERGAFMAGRFMGWDELNGSWTFEMDVADAKAAAEAYAVWLTSRQEPSTRGGIINHRRWLG